MSYNMPPAQPMPYQGQMMMPNNQYMAYQYPPNAYGPPQFYAPNNQFYVQDQPQMTQVDPSK